MGGTGRPAESIFYVVAPGYVAGPLGRQHPICRKGFDICEVETSAPAPVVGIIEKVFHRCRAGAAEPRFGILTAVRIIVCVGKLSVEGETATFVATQIAESQFDRRTVVGLARQGKRAGRRTVEEFPARLLRAVIVVPFPLTPRVGKTGPEGKENLFAVGVLQFEIGLQRVVVCESPGLRIRKVVVPLGHEGSAGCFAPVVHETVVKLGGSRGFQAFEPGGIVIHAGLLLRRKTEAHRSGSSLFREKDYDTTATDRRVSGIAHERQLVFFRIARHQDAAGVEEAAVVNHLGRPVPGQRAAQPRLHVAEPAFLELLLELQVHHLLAIFRHAGEFLGIGLLVDDLHLVHHLGGQILQGHFRVIGEKGLAAHRNARDGFAIILDGAVVRDFHAGHALDQVFQHGILPELERGCIENHGILPDLDGIADGRDARGIEQLRVFRQGDRT